MKLFYMIVQIVLFLFSSVPTHTFSYKCAGQTSPEVKYVTKGQKTVTQNVNFIGSIKPQRKATYTPPACLHNAVGMLNCSNDGYKFQALVRDSKIRGDVMCKYFKEKTLEYQESRSEDVILSEYMTTPRYQQKLETDVKVLTDSVISTTFLADRDELRRESVQKLVEVEQWLADSEAELITDSFNAIQKMRYPDQAVSTRGAEGTTTYNTPPSTKRFDKYMSSTALRARQFHCTFYVMFHMEVRPPFQTKPDYILSEYFLSSYRKSQTGLEVSTGKCGVDHSKKLVVDRAGLYSYITVVPDTEHIGKISFHYKSYMEFGIKDIFARAFEEDPLIKKNEVHLVGVFGSSLRVEDCVNHLEDQLTPGVYAITTNGTCIGASVFKPLSSTSQCVSNIWGPGKIGGLVVTVVDIGRLNSADCYKQKYEGLGEIRHNS